jgi:hypothetical protein
MDLVQIMKQQHGGALAERSSSGFLPILRMVHPIEGDGKPWHFNLTDNGATLPLTEPFRLTVILAREATKRLYVDETGNKKAERAYAPLGAQGTSSALHHQHLEALGETEGITDENGTYEWGYSYLCALLTKAGIRLAQMDSYKMFRKSTKVFLDSAQFLSGNSVHVGQCDWSTLIRKGKTGNLYLDPTKVSKVLSLTPLTQDDIQHIQVAVTNNQNQIQNYLRL